MGDWVLVRREDLDHQFRAERKFQRRWNGPYVVVAIDTATSTYTVRELDGTELRQRYPGKRVKFFHRRGETAEDTSFIDETDGGTIDDSAEAAEFSGEGDVTQC